MNEIQKLIECKEIGKIIRPLCDTCFNPEIMRIIMMQLLPDGSLREK